MPNTQGVKNGAFGSVADAGRRLPWGSTVLVIVVLSALSWAAVIGLIAVFRVFH
jgi:hypothetical protein